MYVAGWGRLRNEDCFTDDHGPNRHARCRFDYFYQGKLYDRCNYMPSPTIGNKRCQQFKLDKGKRAMPKPGETLMIMYNKKQRSTVCYR